MKIFIVLIMTSYFMVLNATSKKEKINIASLFKTNETQASSKKTTPKLIKLFDSIPDETLPIYQTKTLSKYYSKTITPETAKDANSTKKGKTISLLMANEWQKNSKKDLTFSELKEPQDDEEKTNTQARDNKLDKDSGYYDKVTRMVKNAFSLIGSAYKFGSRNKDSTYDCSSFTQRTFAQIGLQLPRDTIEQSKIGKRISKENLIVGDLLFFTTYRRTVSHVGIYIGDNKMIHASTQKGVTVDDLDDSYYKKRYLFAKRPSFTR